MTYVDGFVVPVPKKNIDAYRRMSRKAGKIWIEHGALDYKECVGDDLDIEGVLSFMKGTKVKPGETVVFAFITYKSRAHRDRVNRKVMADPRMDSPPEDMPFDPRRMMYGGFKAIVDLVAEPE
ncbi:DUF1428 domain-containing protein [Parvibaculum sp.]|jgi:uncharacterized protein YbaA (DUF1428 family)|uniref:DUF1428 domain-containing protein n=1 Tax=Parvibaculum sp. TaxID=2024848 RepID=UPI002FDB1345